MREVLLCPLHLGRYVVGGALAPGMSAERLRPQAEGALRGASARGVERDIGVQQEGDVVARHVHIALVNLGGPGHRIQIFELRTIGIVRDDAVGIAVADAENFRQRLAVRIFHHRHIEFAAADEVDRAAFIESAVGRGGNGRSHERDLDGRVGALDGWANA